MYWNAFLFPGTLRKFLSMNPFIKTPKNENTYFDTMRAYLPGSFFYKLSLPRAGPFDTILDDRPNYFSTQDTHERIARMNPHMKLLVVLRDPTTRALSDYVHLQLHDRYVCHVIRVLVIIIKSPQYTGGDFMFLYRFVRRRRPQILVHAITFEQLFGFLSFLAQLLALTCMITWLHFRRFSSWPWPRFFKVKYGICYISAKNGPIATKRKANIAIELWGSNVTSGFDLGHDLDLEFSRSNIEFAISQPKMVRLPRNEKQTYQLNSGAQMWPVGLTLAMTLTLNFQGQI